MFYLLIVEDEAVTLDQLGKLLLEAFPGIRIDTATTVEEGRRRLEAARPWPYDAVILDIMLPKNDESPTEEPDYTLCMDTAAWMPAALVVHMTSYRDNKDVEEHIQRVHVTEGLVRGFALYKFGKSGPSKGALDPEFGMELVRKLRAGLYGDYVRQETAQLFATEGAAVSGERSRMAGGRFAGVSSTHRMTNLIQQISDNWDYLQETDRRIVKGYFAVDDRQRPVRVSLLPLDDGAHL